MKKELLEKFIRVRVTKDDKVFIENYIINSEITISELFRELIKELRYANDKTD